MKNLVFLLVFLLPGMITAQMSSNDVMGSSYLLISNAPKSELQVRDLNYQDEIKHLRYCLGKYRQEKLTGFWLTAGGSFTAALSVSLYRYDVINQETAAIGYIAGGVSMVSGGVMQLISHRWLKKAYMGPSGSGFAIGLNF